MFFVLKILNHAWLKTKYTSVIYQYVKNTIFLITHILHYPIQSFTCSTFGASCTTSNMFDTIFLSVEKNKKKCIINTAKQLHSSLLLILNNKLFTPSPFMPAFLTQACAAGTAFGVIVAFKAWKGETLLSLQTGLLLSPFCNRGL